jgi:hypothetical protein
MWGIYKLAAECDNIFLATTGINILALYKKFKQDAGGVSTSSVIKKKVNCRTSSSKYKQSEGSESWTFSTYLEFNFVMFWICFT